MSIRARIRNLQALRNWSIRAWGRAAGVNDSALAGWLQGVPGRLSEERVQMALDVLGLDSTGRLAHDRVHQWEIRNGDGLAAMRDTLAISEAEWEMVPLTFDAGLMLPPVPLYALRGGGVRIIVRYRPRAMSIAPSFPTPELLAPVVHWAKGLDMEHPRRIDDAIGRAWWSGAEVSLDEFDRVAYRVDVAVSNDVTVSWADVQRAAEAVDMGPADVLRMIKGL